MTHCTHCGSGLGMSARAIAFRGEKNHPHDPADLKRCVDYCRSQGITTDELRKRMAGRSAHWDALLPEWDRLCSLLEAEIRYSKDGKAPLTYAAMREALDAVKR